MENNGLIAKFMGQKKNKNGKYDIPKHPYEYHWMGNSYDYFPENMRYDQSWDWLMPVVSKITRNESYIDNEYRESILDTIPYGIIEDSYKVVIEFIEWYNKEIKDA